jgi:hypothetical protein
MSIQEKFTFDVLKDIIDGLLPFAQWEKAVKENNRGKNKADITDEPWMAPVTSYLKLIVSKLNEAGFRTQRGEITVHYLLKFIRSKGDEGLHFLFGDHGVLRVILYLWGYKSKLQTKLKAILSLKKTRNFESNKSNNIRTSNQKSSKSMSERLYQALDYLEGRQEPSKPRSLRPWALENGLYKDLMVTSTRKSR